jgi:hypothetical protein
MTNSSFRLQECIDKYTFVEEDEEVDSPFARMPRKFGRSSSAASTTSPSPKQRFGQGNHHSHQHASTFRSDQRLRDAADPSSAFSTAEELDLSPGGRDSSLSLSSSVGSESSSASLVCLYSGPGGGPLSPLMPLSATPMPPSLLSPPVVTAGSGANRQLTASGPSMSRASRQDLHSHLWPEEKHRRGNRSPPEQQPAKSAAALPTAGVPLRTNLGPNVRQQNMGSFGSLVNTVAPPLSPTPPIECEAGGGGGGPPAAEVQHLCQLSKPLPTEPIRRVDLGFGRNPLDKALRFHRGTECYIKKIPQAVVAPFRRHLPEQTAAAPLLPVTPIHRASIAAASAAAAASSVHSGSDSSVMTTAGEAVLTESVSRIEEDQPAVEATVLTSETLSAESAAGCSSSGSPQSKKICSSEVSQEPQNKVSPSRVESPTPPPQGVTPKSDSDKPKRGGAACSVKRSPASLSEQSEPSLQDTTTRQRPECRRRDSQESPVAVSCAKRSLRQMKQKQQEEEQRFISLPGGPEHQILMSRLTSCQVEVLKLHPGPEAVVTASSSKLGPRRKSRAGPGDSSENAAKVPVSSSDCRPNPALPEVKLVEVQEPASVPEAASVTTCVSDLGIGAAVRTPEPVLPVVDVHSLHVSNSDAASPLDSCEAKVLPDKAEVTPQPSPYVPGLLAEAPCGAVTREVGAEDSGQQIPARKRKRRLNRTGFPSHKAKKRKMQCEPLPAEEKININSCDMDVEASVSPALLHSSVPGDSIPDGGNVGVSNHLSTPLLMENKNSDVKLMQTEVTTPSLQPKDRMQPKRSLEAVSGRPAAATTRGRPAKRPRGRPQARTLETTAVAGAHSSSNNTSSIEPSPASSDVESLDYRWVQSVPFRVADPLNLIQIRTSSVNLTVTFPRVFFRYIFCSRRHWLLS